MIIKYLAEIVFYGLVALLAIYSVLMVYVLIRFGRSKVLGVILSAFYVVIIVSLYAAAVGDFIRITFPEFSL